MEKELTPLEIFHMLLSALLILGDALFLTFFLRNEAHFIVITSILVDIAALFCEFFYFLNDYSKSGAVYYKWFIRLIAVSYLLDIVMIILFSLHPVLIPLRLASAFALLYMSYKKDLGKKNCWKLFAVIFVVEILLSALSLAQSFTTLTAVLAVNNLLLTGSLGLMIKGKYDDKDARGTV